MASELTVLSFNQRFNKECTYQFAQIMNQEKKDD